MRVGYLRMGRIPGDDNPVDRRLEPHGRATAPQAQRQRAVVVTYKRRRKIAPPPEGAR